MNTEFNIKRYEVECQEKWKEIISQIPSLKFKKKWEVIIIPPFAGAVARFLIAKKGEHICSVYLDWYKRLGFCGGEPYYEIYPNLEGDTSRYTLNQTDELLKEIDKLFKRGVIK